jgi:sulfate/thiosulfate-binding protein
MTEIHQPLSRRGLLAAGGTALAAASVAGASRALAAAGPVTLLNVSYDPTRELYAQINPLFIADWKAKTGQDVKINQSHGGGGAQTRSVIDGNPADVVTLALSGDINEIVNKAHLIDPKWQSRLPDNATPYTSTIIFLVRKGNPWKIKTWDDLIKPGISVITPNPKTSGGARWAYLAAWAHAQKAAGGTPATAQAFVQKLYKQVPVLDTGARGSTVTFAQRGLGDVLLAWENEAYLAIKEFGPKFDIVYPADSILAEPPVAVVDKVVDRKKTRAIAEAYLKFLYTPQAQEVIAQNHYRPRDAAVIAKHKADFPAIKLTTIDDPIFGGWSKAQPYHFGDGGIFDKIYHP